MSEWKFLNYDSDTIPDPSQPFTLNCSPETDLWEKPPSTHSANAPCLVRTINKGSFVSAKVRVTATWVNLYDQGGLVILVSDGSDKPKWIKTGIEFFNGQPQVSTVSTFKWSDWSLRPMPSQNSTSATIEIAVKEGDSLWVYLINDEGEKVPMREVAWWGEIEREAQLSVGVCAAKPSKDPEKLLVSFEGFEIKSQDP